MSFPVEDIPNGDHLFRRVPRSKCDDEGRPHPEAFADKGEGMSTAWDRYCTAEECRATCDKPRTLGVVRLAVTATHKLVVRDGVLYEEIEVRCLTPGIATRVANVDKVSSAKSGLRVSFEEGRDGIYFSVPINDVREGQSEKPVEYRLYSDSSGQTNFEGKAYDVQGNAVLLIDREALSSRQRTHDVLPGWKFPDASSGKEEFPDP